VNSKCGWAEEEAPAAVLANMHAADMESCDICGLETTDLVHCRNRHAFCINDFSRHIDFVINRSRQNFIENGCALPCSLCKGELRNPAGFQRQCASQLDDRAYSFYEAAITEKAVIAAQSECELRIRSSFKPASQDPDENTIGKMVSFHHTPPYTSLHPVRFLYGVALKMAHYDAVGIPYSVCNLKRNETKKYRDAVCREWHLRFQPIAGDGNCFFESVSTAMAHFTPQLLIPATDLRHRIVEWLVAAKVRTPHPYTTIFGQQLKPVHHLTPPRYRTECMERLGLNA
jgi:hypothetical protein